jgi:hypothetical protein
MWEVIGREARALQNVGVAAMWLVSNSSERSCLLVSCVWCRITVPCNSITDTSQLSLPTPHISTPQSQSARPIPTALTIPALLALSGVLQ